MSVHSVAKASVVLLLASSTIWNANAARSANRELATARAFVAGDFVPIAEGVLSNGERVRIGESTSMDTWQVIVLASPNCPHCMASLDAWMAIQSEAAARGHEFLVIATDAPVALESVIRRTGIDAPVAAVSHQRMRSLLRMDLVPQILVVNALGEVLATELGELGPNDEGAARIIGLLRTGLPV